MFCSKHPSFGMFGSKAFATFKWPFATCGEWRMGSTMPSYDNDFVLTNLLNNEAEKR